MKLSSLKTNVAAVEQGAWIKDLPGWDGLQLRVRGLSNSHAKALRTKLQSALPPARVAMGQVSDAERAAIEAQVLHETVLLDWKGLENDDGSEMAYEPGLALQLLSAPEWEAFRGIVLQAASIVASLEAGAEADAAKN